MTNMMKNTLADLRLLVAAIEWERSEEKKGRMPGPPQKLLKAFLATPEGQRALVTRYEQSVRNAA
jgi:hypothetical protein